ncbi:efflux RND transporter periplasmic adaptor subunit [Mesorhizobium xinjiangense]|uniref:efflux RND transporter periplasmic adaptor subunit n=1 Tax=Mesorhizobium xinjiangense TaxID=2678685 RepID=UPI0018DC604E|nr:efflux RND transporter periplasmic adaptor subunit [Mesorhizobium xinjiangense]
MAGCSAESETSKERSRPIAWTVVEAASGKTTRRLTGVARAAQRTALSFEVSGVVEDVFVEPGERFAAGEALATIDTQKLALMLEQREGELQEAQAKRAEAERDLARKRQLHEKQWIADAALGSARAAHDAAGSRVAALAAAVERAKQDFRDATLYAPYEGVVAERLVEPSQQVSAGQTALRIEGRAGGMEVVVAAPETIVGRLSLGASGHEISLPAVTARPFKGTVTEIAPQSTEGNAYPVTLRIDAEEVAWRSGMTAEVTLHLANDDTGADQPLLSIPLTAFLLEDDAKAVAFRFDEETSTVTRVPITIAKLTGSSAIISKGLVTGDIIAAQGVAFLRDGQAVTRLGVGIALFNP